MTPPLRTLTATTSDGITLYADEWGPPTDASPILCLPGYSRNARDFHPLCTALDQSYRGEKRIIAMDSRGRGRSGWAPSETYTTAREITDVVEVMAAWQMAKAHVVGTSRGGILAMGLAVGAPDRLGRVVLNDIGPIVEDSGLQRITNAVGKSMEHPSFEALAQDQRRRFAADFPTMTDADWLRFAKQIASPIGEGDGVRLAYDPELGPRFNPNPTEPLPDMWPAFDALSAERPVLVVRGVNSDILSAATLEAMVRREGVSGLSVADEGHAPLLWDTRTQDAIVRFFRAP